MENIKAFFYTLRVMILFIVALFLFSSPYKAQADYSTSTPLFSSITNATSTDYTLSDYGWLILNEIFRVLVTLLSILIFFVVVLVTFNMFRL